MPTITTVDVAWAPGPVEFTDAEARRFDTAMFLGDGSNNGVRGGVVRHGDNSLAVSVNGSDQVTVQAGAVVIPGASGMGVYRGALSAATSAVGIDPRNATNPRIDLVVFRSTGAVDVITGTPGSSPSAPALPANAVELGRINIPALGGGAAIVDSTWRQYATAIGGRLVAATAARLPGSGNTPGQRAQALDSSAEHFWNGTAWQRVGPTMVTASTDLTLTDTITQIPNLNVVTSAAGTGTVFVLHADLDVSILNADNVASWQFFVDNAAYGGNTVLAMPGVGRWSSSRTAVVTGLAPGPHTFTVRANRTGSPGGSIVREVHSTFVVDVRP